MGEVEVPAKAIAEIVERLNSNETTEIYGAKLGELVKDILPNFRALVDIPKGPGALSKFIETYLSQSLIKKDKRGADWVYEIISPKTGDAPNAHIASSSVLSSTGIDSSTWTFFENASSSHKLVLDSDAKQIHRVLNGAPQHSRELPTIAPVSEAELTQIRATFLAEDISKYASRNATEEVRHAPFSKWIAFLKRDADAYWHWLIFRREQTLGIFAARLRDLGLDPATTEYFVDAFSQAKRPAKNKTESFSSSRATNTVSLPRENAADKKLRQSLLRIISQMPVADLRNIPLPFGVVYDAFKDKNK